MPSCARFRALYGGNPYGPPILNCWTDLIARDYKTIEHVCSWPYLNIGLQYVTAVASLGMFFMFMELMRAIKCASMPWCWDYQCKSSIPKYVNESCERDVKLIFLVLCVETYALLLVGTYTDVSALFVPWLILHSFIILYDFIECITRLMTLGLHFSKIGLVMRMLIICTWLVVFCSFFRLHDDYL